MESMAYFGRRFMPTAECSLPVTDLVIQRGVGVFDTIRAYSRRPFALAAHLDRLAASAEGAGIEGGEALRELERAIKDGLERPDCPEDGDCSVKAYITGGDLNDNGSFPRPRAFALFDRAAVPSPEEYERGVALEPTPEGRPSPAIKSVNYLFGFMQTAGMDGVLECLYCPGGDITETLRSNFFAVIDGRLVTAPVDRVLCGVTRGVVATIAREAGFEIEERCPALAELDRASEAFVTSTLKEVMPVTRVGAATIGDGRPGPVSKRLRELFRKEMHRWLS